MKEKKIYIYWQKGLCFERETEGEEEIERVWRRGYEERRGVLGRGENMK